VERAHRELRARLANRLCGDDAHRVADLRHLTGGEERAVAVAAHAELASALQHRADGHLHLVDGVAERLDDVVEDERGQFLALLGHHGLARLAARERLVHLDRERPPEQALVDSLGHVDR